MRHEVLLQLGEPAAGRRFEQRDLRGNVGVIAGGLYCEQGTAIDGLMARRRYKPLTLADPLFDLHLASASTR